MTPPRQTLFGRFQVAEPPSALLDLHVHDGSIPLKEVDHEPQLAVLDQEDLLAQGIRVSEFIPGAVDADALGSCTANAFIAAASTILDGAKFRALLQHLTGKTPADPYGDTTTAEKAAISFYYQCTHQTGDPGQEWPPTDCGSSGPYVVSEAKRLGAVKGAKIAHGADSIVSLMQQGPLIVGQPFLNDWMEPDTHGFIDGNGKVSTVQAQIQDGIAGGHETVLSAVEKLALTPTGHVDPSKTVIRFRNSWTRSWGDAGSYRAHLSTYVLFGGQCDFRLLIP